MKFTHFCEKYNKEYEEATKKLAHIEKLRNTLSQHLESTKSKFLKAEDVLNDKRTCLEKCVVDDDLVSSEAAHFKE